MTPDLVSHINDVHGSWSVREHCKVVALADLKGWSFGRSFVSMYGQTTFDNLASKRGHPYKWCGVGESVRWTPAQL